MSTKQNLQTHLLGCGTQPCLPHELMQRLTNPVATMQQEAWPAQWLQVRCKVLDNQLLPRWRATRLQRFLPQCNCFAVGIYAKA